MEQLRDDTGGLLRDSPVARAELQIAKARVLANPGSRELRLELAEAYRVRGFPDQAGRWGILEEGWPTPVELDRLARLLSGTGMSVQEIRKILAIPAGTELPTVLTDVLSDPARFSRSHRAGGSKFAQVLGNVFAVSAAVAFCSFVGTLLLVFFVAVVGGGDSTRIARGGGLATVSLTLIAVLLGIVSARIDAHTSPPSE